MLFITYDLGVILAKLTDSNGRDRGFRYGMTAADRHLLTTR